MPTYTLYYFNGRGRAEICRMLFAAAGVQYNDKRIQFADWNQLKPKMPGSMLPVLEIDGRTQIPQSMTIARFLAREFGFHGKNNLDMARVDYICDSFYDLLNDYMRMFYEKDVNKKVDMRNRYLDTSRRILPFMERTLLRYNNGNQFFLGEHMLMCDMMCFAALENPMIDNAALLKEYPKLRDLRIRVASHPKIAAYFKKRCQTSF